MRQTRSRRRSTPESVAAKRAERAEQTDPGPVMDAAATFLAVRPRSVSETKRRLSHLGYSPALVEQVIEQLVELGYLDDVAFARAWVESRDRARPRGELALRRELALKGVPRDAADEAMAGRSRADGSVPDVVAAIKLLDRRRSALEREADPVKRRNRAYALLARNGFDADVCRTAATTFIDARRAE